MSETVTTIIPTYQRAQLLERAVRSALAQTHADVKVCVYDNASSDETPAVAARLAAWDSRVSYYRHERHLSVQQNFLFGMQQVSTPFFSFLSDDDVLFPRFYEAALAHLNASPEALCAAGSAIEFDERGRVRYAPVALWPRAGVYRPLDGLFAMLGNRHPTWTAIVFRRAALTQVGELDAEIIGPMDLDYELRLAAHHAFLVFYEPSAAYVHHPQRVSAQEDAKVLDGFVRMTEKLLDDPVLPAAQRPRIRRLLGQQMRRKLHEIAVKALIAGEDDRARAAGDVLNGQFNHPLDAGLINVAAYLSDEVPLFRWLLARVEAVRIWLRARRAMSRLRATSGSDGRQYAGYLALDGARP